MGRDSNGEKGAEEAQKGTDTTTTEPTLQARTSESSGEVGFPVVGLGASAGGLEALEEFFEHVPKDSGMAYVVVTHLHAGRPSMMHEILGRKTTLPVVEADEAMMLEPNHVYVAPPGKLLTLMHGVLRPTESGRASATGLPIDLFFRSLAEDRRELAIGVILSGAGTDGTVGIKEIKGVLGLVVAQQDAEARYPPMPRSAIATGMVDLVLPAKEMPARLVDYAKDAGLLPPRTPLRREPQLPPEPLNQLLAMLRNRTGHDFSQYKKSTVNRRIERRMTLHRVESLRKYVRFMQEHPDEANRLFKELLIGVTSFFRDAEAFDALQAALIEKLRGAPTGRVIRAWVPGCSTGEEAYSIAIIFREILDKLGRQDAVQIFATDLDEEAIEVARRGIYPLGIANDVLPNRLERYFAREEDGFQVKKEVREMVVFAPQNLVGDPPFTRLDLISCRNLLIYLEGTLQERLLPMFHYALNPGGTLFLGSSETVGSAGHLFEAIDKKWKVFRRIEVPERVFVPNIGTVPGRPAAPAPTEGRRQGPMGPALAAEYLLASVLVPPTLLIRERGEIVHIHGRTGEFLEPAPGPQMVPNVYNMLRKGLELELAAAVRQAASREHEVIRPGVRVKTNGQGVLVDLRVRRVIEPERFRGLFLVTFDRRRELEEGEGKREEEPPPDRVFELEQQLQYTKESHQGTVEELETTNEELKSTNEELQSTNEELQSTNEELETSKEEMQSLNEEMETVNAELQRKVDELSRANDDMNNLLNAIEIATLFLDNQLHIKRYTIQAQQVIRVRPSDVGRPIQDLTSRLRYQRLVEDAREVLSSLVSKEVDVQAEDGAWFLMRIMPYRTTENLIDGLVITFVDITKVKRLKESEQRLLDVLGRSSSAAFGQDKELRYVWACRNLFGHEREELLGRTDAEVFGAEQVKQMTDVKREALRRGSYTRRRVHIELNGQERIFDLVVDPIRGDDGEAAGICCVATDLTSTT